MNTSPPTDPAGRIADLERQLRELRARIAEIEKRLETRLEHPTDGAVVRGKVTYDWQK